MSARYGHRHIIIGLLLACLAIISTSPVHAQETDTSDAADMSKPRLLISTDIGGNDEDDEQSLIRFLHYANEFDIEGLLSGSNVNQNAENAAINPQLFVEIIERYALVRDNLALHADGYPTAEALLDLIKEGQPIAGPGVPIEDSVGPDKDTEASDWIIEVVLRDDPRPVNIVVWGGTTDLAQALWRAREDMSSADFDQFVSRIRVHAIADQDSTTYWVQEQFPNLFYIVNVAPDGQDRFTSVFRGMYLRGETFLSSREWVDAHLRSNHGPLAARYPERAGGINGVKEGDTPSWFYFYDNGLNYPEDPTWGGWGGRFEPRTERYFVDAEDRVGTETSRMATVWRWRPDFQNDFQARADWAVLSYDEANHNPVATLAAPNERQVAAGEVVRLDASASSDPDGDSLSYDWFYYPEPSTYTGDITLENADAAQAQFTAPLVTEPQTVHIILRVTDDGAPNLTSYQRVIVTVEPPATTDLFEEPGYGLTARYYTGTNFDTFVSQRLDARVAFNWERNSPVDLPEDGFSASWSGFVVPAHSETYTFYALADDGVRLLIDNQVILDDWSDHPPRESSGTVDLEAGQAYPIVLEYYENEVGAQIQLSWSSASQPKTVIPQANLYPDTVAVQAGVRIMPIGDSITQANRDGNSYRRALWQQLTSAGYIVDFVGSQDENFRGSPPDADFDLDHEGYWGQRADEVLPRLAEIAPENVPDIALIHIGTNDLFQGESTEDTVADIAQMIEALRAANDRVIVLLAQLIPHNDGNQPAVADLNDAIAELVSSTSTGASPVMLVDQVTGFNPEEDTYDGVHPNATGEAKIAERWFENIVPFLDALLIEAENDAVVRTQREATATRSTFRRVRTDVAQTETSSTPVPVAVVAQAGPAPVTIMPIGDSITEANSQYNSYRRPLWFALNNAGYSVDFVGRETANYQGGPPNQDFDRNHESYWGWRADEILAMFPAITNANTPDIALIHLGTNDIFQSQSVSSTISEISQIIDALRAANPDVVVLLAQVIPHNRGNRPPIEPLNVALLDLAISKNTTQSPVVPVDQYTGFSAFNDTWDAVHPNTTGEQKMADRWFAALEPFLQAAPPSNAAPTADAGADQLVLDNDESGSESVTLDGTASSDSDGSIVSYDWRVNNQPLATGSNPTVNLATGSYVIELTVTDDEGATGTDTVNITVSPPTDRVTANLIALYTFDEGNGNTVSDTSGYQTPLNLTISNGATWGTGTLTSSGQTLIASSGPASKLTSAITATNEVTLEAWIEPASLSQFGPARIMSLSGDSSNRNATLGQGLGSSGPYDVFDVRFRTTDTTNNGIPSVTSAGGSASLGLQHVVAVREASGTVRIYVDGQQVAQETRGGSLANWNGNYAFAIANEITGDRGWAGTFHLVALYSRALSQSDVQQNFTAGADGNAGDPPPNQAPVADAGPDQDVTDDDGDGFASVTLDGSASTDADGSIVTYEWYDGDLLSNEVTPTFALQPGFYTFTLIVVDDDGAASQPDEVEVIVTEAPNQAPVADAGPDQTVIDNDENGSETVTLDGTASSDSDGTVVSYTWRLDGNVIAMSATSQVNLPVGTHTISLTVTDDDGASSAADEVVITINAPVNAAPTADAGPDQTVEDSDESGSEDVTLDGSASSDADGTIASYTWQLNGNPLAAGATPTVSLPVGVHTISLTVTDNLGAASAADEVVITVNGVTDRVTESLVALYTFDEGSGTTVTDTSGYQTPLNLTIPNPGAVTWGMGTLTINSETLIASSSAASKITSAITATNEVTLEAWIEPASLSQFGPARIMSLSGDSSNRNATLGQGLGSNGPFNVFDVRIRTTDTTNNGIPSVTSAGGSASLSLQHVVAVREADGTVRIYVDGQQVAQETRGGSLANWNGNYALALANEITGSRGWLGTFHLVAFYSQALDQSAVQQNFTAGADGNAGDPPPNQAPVADAGPDQTVTDDDGNSVAAVTLDGSASTDADGTITSYQWMEGANTVATGATPTVDLAIGTRTLTLVVTDDDGATNSDDVVITVNPAPNVDPIADAGPDQTVTDSDGSGSETITLDGTGSSDDDGTIISYQWTENNVALANGPSPMVNLAVGTYTITLTVTDDANATATDTVVITVNAPDNQAPVADAGPDQTVTDSDGNGSESVTLDGSASSDADGTVNGYMWVAGGVMIASGATPTVDLPVGVNTISLTVLDDDGATSAADQVVITVNPPANQDPIADAGPDQTLTDNDGDGFESVTLDGSASSDPDGSITQYTWRSGGQIVAQSPTPQVSVSVPVGVTLIELIVTDNLGGRSVAVGVNITVNAGSNNDPARVTQDLVALYTFDEGSGTTVTDTSGYQTPLNLSIPNAGAVTWGNSTLTINSQTRIGSNGAASKINAAAIASNEITVEAWIVPANLTQGGPARIAAISGDSSNRNVTLGQGLWGSQPRDLFDVRMRTTSTTNNGLPSTSTPAGSATLGLTHVVAVHEASGTVRMYVNGVPVATQNVGGSFANWDANYVLSLANEVTGDRGWLGTYHLVAFYGRALSEGEVQQNYNAGADGAPVQPPANQAPIANAGPDQTVTDSDGSGTESVTLDGSASSDADGTIVSYSWVEGVNPLATTAIASVDLPVGVHTITLTVTDDDGATATDTVVITVNAPDNQAPVADAGPDQTLTDNDADGFESVTLDGSASSDADGTITSYVWSQGDPFIGENVIETITLPVGTYIIDLTVTDDDGATATDTVVITVNAAPVNQDPIANAGPDQTLTDNDADGFESVTLDGSASSDPDGSIVEYTWRSGGQIISQGPTPQVTVSVPVGVTLIELIVTDNLGGRSVAAGVNITVNAGSNNDPARVTQDLVALYTFDEGSGNTVTDTSGYQTPLNLSITDAGAVAWGAGTLTINSQTRIGSNGAASKINMAGLASNEITVEAWIVPANLTQGGPARIASISGDSSNRNVTLGQGLWGDQARDLFDVRMRTTNTTNNGLPSTSTPAGSATLGLTHVVAVHQADGTVRMYVNGVPVATQNVGGNFANWDANYVLSLANEVTGDRGWLGTYHLVAFYGRALSEGEVQQNYNAGS